MSDTSTRGDLETQIADVIGRLMEYWGFKAIMGRLWTFLYLSAEPLSAAELAERLSVSTGSISMTLNDLQKWGVVKKTWRPGERRDFYEPETGIWKMVSRVLRERELVYVHDSIAAFETAKARAGELKVGATTIERTRLRFIEARLNTLLALSRVSEGVIRLIIEGKTLDLSPLRSFLGGDPPGRS